MTKQPKEHPSAPSAQNNLLILAMESSCDETAAAVVGEDFRVYSNVIASSAGIHAKYGGVVPEIASRKHMEYITQVVEETMQQANVGFSDLSAIAVTRGPGLAGALLCGVGYAKGIAYARNLPLIGVNHMIGHICANHLVHPDLKPPYLCLVVSGGHTHLLLCRGPLKLELLGCTRDDAAGEAFDKVARAVGLGYPGGQQVEQLAKQGDENAYHFASPAIPHTYDFSFSGIKTGVINLIHHAQQKGERMDMADVAASFQKAAVDALLEHTFAAAQEYGIRQVALCGGVSANGLLREQAIKRGKDAGCKVFLPDRILCTDNAAMIGCAAQFYYREGIFSDLTLNADPGLDITTI